MPIEHTTRTLTTDVKIYAPNVLPPLCVADVFAEAERGEGYRVEWTRKIPHGLRCTVKAADGRSATVDLDESDVMCTMAELALTALPRDSEPAES